MSMEPEARKLLEEAQTRTADHLLHPRQPLDPRLEALDHSTLFTSAAIVSQVGFSHFDLSNDTRLGQEARKAHRFVAMNCEEIGRKILRLTGAEETDVTAMLYQIRDQVVAHRQATHAELNKAPVPESLKQ